MGTSSVSINTLDGRDIVACECWARDGLQSVPKFIPTASKVEMLDRFTDAGFRKMASGQSGKVILDWQA